MREELWQLEEALKQRAEQLVAERTPATDPAPQGDPAPPEFSQCEGHGFGFAGLGVDLALEMCWKSLPENGGDMIAAAVLLSTDHALSRVCMTTVKEEERFPFRS